MLSKRLRFGLYTYHNVEKANKPCCVCIQTRGSHVATILVYLCCLTSHLFVPIQTAERKDVFKEGKHYIRYIDLMYDDICPLLREWSK